MSPNMFSNLNLGADSDSAVGLALCDVLDSLTKGNSYTDVQDKVYGFQSSIRTRDGKQYEKTELDLGHSGIEWIIRELGSTTITMRVFWPDGSGNIGKLIVEHRGAINPETMLLDSEMIRHTLTLKGVLLDFIDTQRDDQKQANTSTLLKLSQLVPLYNMWITIQLQSPSHH
ncbi:hypothetical protein TREMEDRAFT_64337 [Tremella mesenterica DSM 1558]|uniref:uncharacterized protein n=1 Tax=Tremella mesenterica (strain ATCC 24925 / CBS 8224 / DSM 1558 / NBRC 9311 / NRRL Y-6157 / RJB 2259-6 / UBC 559-6) TaxID=578456 RepID=UPI0003F48DD9|nr:uncharacterized protein TREMEDRAFT_64337 [Tremella mesenterica DSM 1558]EIW67745.1 hypothetical protein TREMEDRAFT_64337 [Tremella mesenterica DSM 1558]